MTDTTRRAPGRARRAPSMADVAAHAGVSSQTVSRVANGLTNVDDGTRDRVLEAMTELGYRPNKAARALRSGRTRSIGITMFTLSSYGNMRTLDAITVQAARAGYSVTVVPVEYPTQRDVAVALDSLREQDVDGLIIVIESHIVDGADVELPAGLPVVVIDSAARTDYPVVDNDQAQGAALATQHLLDLGHQGVWHIAGPRTSYSAARREQSWADTLREAGITPPPAFRGDWSTTSGYEIGLEIAERPEITAVFASNDQMALGLLRALHERGRAVPESISVVGFDDTPESDSFWPPLTTVHQDFDEIGRRAITTLLREIEEGPQLSTEPLTPTSLVVRASTAPPPAH
ncbi:LacI family transcriptional regulator [Plantibacter sp. H53]|uniref:LacI family DNA-binding transcriptional regulator n=1 Tax=unclassified Plantibacter TaxID=2624265 RepID=UPI0007D90973|nr:MULTISPECIES: LacI family DNA-binding transcriptional regulator [unclassified Plantibacter]OAN30313.1 LacI family transcriptional regulator [Plantibacter sp. H53]OII43539.1 LacI family transcriptional regulator [Plantibacter sp. MMLR14_011]